MTEQLRTSQNNIEDEEGSHRYKFSARILKFKCLLDTIYIIYIIFLLVQKT